MSDGLIKFNHSGTTSQKYLWPHQHSVTAHYYLHVNLWENTIIQGFVSFQGSRLLLGDPCTTIRLVHHHWPGFHCLAGRPTKQIKPSIITMLINYGQVKLCCWSWHHKHLQCQICQKVVNCAAHGWSSLCLTYSLVNLPVHNLWAFCQWILHMLHVQLGYKPLMETITNVQVVGM